MDSWYFAYGSNLWMHQMLARTGAIGTADHPPRTARLANHRLIFQCLDKTGAAFANILAPGDGVLGVAYRCSPADLEKLDDYERGYERQSVTVTDANSAEFDAVAYVMRSATGTVTGSPSAEYLERIVTGARQHGLPEAYISGIIASASSATHLRGRSSGFDF